MLLYRFAIVVCVLVISTNLLASSNYGSLSVSSNPSGAQIFLNNVNRGVTPLTIGQLPPRTFHVMLRKTDYQDWTGRVSIRSGEQSSLSGVLVSIYGSLKVTSNPSGAQVFLNNVNKGITPLTINRLLAGTYSVILRKTGYQDWTGSVSIRSGAQSNLSQSLVLAYGTLSVTSNPLGAQVFLNNVYKGITPLTINRLSAGTYNVILRKTDYQDWTGSVAIESGKQGNLSQNLVSIYGTLSIQSNPSGAQVFLHGNRSEGYTPLVIRQLQPNNYSVGLETNGYQRGGARVAVTAGVQTDVSFTLIPLPGRLWISSAPPDATVFIGAPGTDPTERGQTSLFVEGLTPGTHTVVLRKQGFQDSTRTYEQNPGGHNAFFIKLVPLRNAR